MTLLEGTNLRKTYRMSRRTSVDALRGVDVSIAAGEMVAIMGPSGSGKSTLMHVLGLLHAPDRDGGLAPGLRFNGIDVTNLSDRERTRIRARSMGFVFQSFNLVPTLTAEENVALAAEYAGTSRSQARVAAREALASVGLADRATHRPMELSGGEQQRAAIARALVNDPTIILGDEPTGNLDSARAAEVLALLRTFNRERGQTVLLVTHDAEVGAICDRIIRMRDGVIVADERVPARATLEADIVRPIASSTPGAAIPVSGGLSGGTDRVDHYHRRPWRPTRAPLLTGSVLRLTGQGFRSSSPGCPPSGGGSDRSSGRRRQPDPPIRRSPTDRPNLLSKSRSQR